MPLGTEVGLGPGGIVLDGDPSPSMERGCCAPFCRQPLSVGGSWVPSNTYFSAHVYCGQTVAHLRNCWALVSLQTSAKNPKCYTSYEFSLLLVREKAWRSSYIQIPMRWTRNSGTKKWLQTTAGQKANKKFTKWHIRAWVGCLTTTSLQSNCWGSRWKKNENWSAFGEVTGKSLVALFWLSVVVQATLY